MNKADKLKEQINKLQAELSRIESTTPVPIPRNEINWEQVINLAKQHIEEIQDEYQENNDDTQWFYEAVMEAVYGKNIWNWINSNTP